MGISREDALDCFKSDDLIGIGMAADAVRRRLHPEGVVSYTIDRKLSYINTLPPAAAAEALIPGIAKTLEMGGQAIVLQGEVTPEATITWFETLLTETKNRFPSLWIHGLSATEILTIADQSQLKLNDTIARLRDAGLDSIPGNDAAILDDAVQHQGPRSKWKTADWTNVHRTAHHLGIRTTATMIFGSGETFEHRVNHLESIRQLQEETGGFTAFTPWTFQPQTSAARGFEEATAVEYLKTLAISRMYLENIENVQANLETQGLKVLQVGLRFGGNDVGSVGLEDTAPAAHATTEEQLRQVIRDAGFKPRQRDTLYRTMFLN
jgi:cyclic dehypoxanthinyl futalosine synthase